LRGSDPKSTSAQDSVDEDKVKKAKKREEEGPPSQSFADMDRKCCLLCSRQFKSEAEVNKHERISELHRDNLKNETLVKKALAALAKKTGADTPEYRDRAKERRSAFGQPKKAAGEPRNDVEPEPEPGPTVSKGAALLGKMGWTAGSGLGAQGTGMAEAIKTDMYVQGVGLGAKGGKVGDAVEEAQRLTKGDYKGFLEKGKDKTRERFDNLG
jgi:RNA-binding protein 5/10